MNGTVIFFGISAAILIGSAILCIKKSHEPPKESESIAPLSFLMGGVLVSAALLFFPLYYHEYSSLPDTVFQSAISSLHHAAQLFTIDADRDIVRLCYEVPEGHIRNLYAILLSAEYIIAPVLTAGFIISFFRNTVSCIRYAMRWFTEAHVFSELNEKSAALAESIHRGNGRATIVFAGVDEKDETVPFELKKRAKTLRAICFRKDISEIRFMGKRSSKKLSFYVIGEDETENINQAISLAQKYKRMDQCTLYVFTTRDECEYLINQRGDSSGEGQESEKEIKIRRVHEISSLIYHNLYRQGYEKLYRTAKTVSEQEKPGKLIAAVIVGAGLHGTEMIKALSWYCQMEGYRLRIDAFDRDPLAEKRFAAACPELLNSPKQENSDGGEACEIHIHSGTDVTTSDFANGVRSLKDTTYVFVSLGTDVLNITTAIRIRTYFAQAGVTTREQVKGTTDTNSAVPVIQAIVYGAYDNDRLKNLANNKNERYSIDFIGDVASTYDAKVILNSALEKKAEAIHTLYYPPESFREYEYYYRSSCAAAIHIRAVAYELSGHQFLGRPVQPELLKQTDLFLQTIDFLAAKPDPGQSSRDPADRLIRWAKDAGTRIIEPALSASETFEWDSWGSGKLIPQAERIIESWKESRKNLSGILDDIRDPGWSFPAESGKGSQNSWVTASLLRSHILSGMSEHDEEIICSVYCILLVEKLKEQEHRRWNAYMRSEGYIKNDSRFDLGKMHPDLRPYSELEREEKYKDIHMDKIAEEMKQMPVSMHVQKTAVRVQAWQLGAGSAKEAEMISSGKIKRLRDGGYELYSREATGGTGQIAKPGDYFKTDSSGLPYPNEKAYFEKMHEHLEDDWYLQKSPVLPAWTAGEPWNEVIRFLLVHGMLQINENDDEHYYSAALWGTTETAAKDAVIVIHEIERNDKNEITNVVFNFVDRDSFEKTYRVVPEQPAE